MKVVTGGARSSRGHLEVGDQSQVGIPDFQGELCIQEYSSVAAFKSGWQGSYTLYRAVNPLVAASLARVMYTAVNNPNIGWTNTSDRMTIFQYGATSTVPCGCDCVSLVGYCVAYSTGQDLGTNLYGLAPKLVSSGLFTGPVPVGVFNDDTNPICTGDVIVGPGSQHYEIIVQGADRSGAGGVLIPGTVTPITGPNGVVVATGFVPRTSAPSPKEPGYSTYYSKNLCATLNASYAWNRFSEILGEPCKLSRGPAERWYISTEDGYQRGMSPNIGAVMCFTSKEGAGGFVCIVESANINDVVVSMVSPITNTFQTCAIGQVDGFWFADIDKSGFSRYTFQGFIYNPRIKLGVTRESKLTSFINTAKQQVGNNGSFVQQVLGYNISQPWSAAFVTAVAKKVGELLDVIIPNTTSCSSIGSIGVGKGMGNWYNGPVNDGRPYPQVGDIALFANQVFPGATRYDSDKAGIVVSVSPEPEPGDPASVSFTYVVGDSSGKVETKKATSGTPSLAGLFRPNWKLVDALAGSGQQGYMTNGYYSQGTSSEDAIIKDYKYISATKEGSQPSITSDTGLMLCALNHSSLNAGVYSVFANMLTQDMTTNLIMNTSLGSSVFDLLAPGFVSEGALGSVDMINAVTGKKVGTVTLNNTVKTIYAFLLNLFSGNNAGAIGFMANIYSESGFNIAAKNSNGASGLCQWLSDGRRKGMISYCQSNGGSWETNLSGQLGYIQYELEHGYQSTLQTCQGCSNSLAGALVASEYVCRHYEIPLHYDYNIPVRAGFTESLWLLFTGVSVAPGQPSSTGGTLNPVNPSDIIMPGSGGRSYPIGDISGSNVINVGSGQASSGGLYGPFTVNGIRGYVWFPSGMNNNTDLIISMPGLGTTDGSKEHYTAFKSVANGYVRPKNAVFFALYDNGSNPSVDQLRGVIEQLREGTLSKISKTLYYFGFSQGAWLYWDYGYGQLGFQGAVLGDGSWSIASGPKHYYERKILLVQSAPGGKGVVENIKKAKEIYDGHAYLQIVDMTAMGVASHAIANYYSGSDNGNTYKGMTPPAYYKSTLPEPRYGLTWL